MASGFEDDIDFDWEDEEDSDDFGPPKSTRNNRYNMAYGDYRGGYGPPGGFGPPLGFGPPRPPGPPRGFGPPPPFMPGPPRQPFMWGRGFGNEGPPNRKFARDDRAIRYLMRCGVTRDHLQNLPRDLLEMIDPQYCGICTQEFQSFSISRVHYTSKNHLKNQRKYLMQRSDVPSRRQEIPLKSRELYCELCDVHITSKTHAESHYAGKPHRAIVEGRKNPKNPFLMQKNMKNRVDQLIRREKKSIKPVEEKSEEKVAESKPIDSELYCDICKTSVTCSDQMTIHLNGKRHLNKEKRHILDMMKGGVNNADKDAEQCDEPAAAEENDDWPSGENEF